MPCWYYTTEQCCNLYPCLLFGRGRTICAAFSRIFALCIPIALLPQYAATLEELLKQAFPPFAEKHDCITFKAGLGALLVCELEMVGNLAICALDACFPHY